MLAEYYDVFEHKHLKHLDKRRIARLRGLLDKVKSSGRRAWNASPIPSCANHREDFSGLRDAWRAGSARLAPRYTRPVTA